MVLRIGNGCQRTANLLLPVTDQAQRTQRKETGQDIVLACLYPRCDKSHFCGN